MGLGQEEVLMNPQDCTLPTREEEQFVFHKKSRRHIDDLPSPRCHFRKEFEVMCSRHEEIKDDHNIQVKRAKREMETKEVRLFKTQVFSIIFETYPVWLLALSTMKAKLIYIPQCNSWTEFCHLISNANTAGAPTLYDTHVTKLGFRRFKLGPPPQEGPHILLVSGSIEFLHTHLQQGKGLGLIDYSQRGR